MSLISAPLPIVFFFKSGDVVPLVYVTLRQFDRIFGLILSKYLAARGDRFSIESAASWEV